MEITGLKHLAIGNLIAKLPIVQGGMGVGVSLSGLAAATANQGGVGVIAAAGIGLLEPGSVRNFFEANIRRLKAEIRKAREMTKGVLGVNIMTALTDFVAMAKAAVEEKVDIIFSGAGLPLSLPEILGESRATKLVPIVSSGRAASILLKRWTGRYNYLPDAFVVEGPKAGGHLGFKPEQIDEPAFALEKIVPDVVKTLEPFEKRYGRSVPVIAGGGVYTGEDIRRIMDLGASGVQLATRFVTTVECDADDAFKRAYIEAEAEDLEIITSPLGMPGRAIRNVFLADMRLGKKKPFACPYHCAATCGMSGAPYCISLALKNAVRGRLSDGFAFAGTNAYRAKRIETVPEVFEAIAAEYAGAVKRE